MKSIINYAKDEQRNFTEFVFNDVDSLILSTLAYYNFENVVPKIFSKDKIKLKDIPSNIEEYLMYMPNKKGYKELFSAVIKNPRFNELFLDNYYERDNVEEEIGFKALTFEAPDFIYISYMGTKASLISWKEDFKLCYLSPLPSQKMALRYLNKISLETIKPIYLGGHSKGGNQAVYAAIHTSILNKIRIKKIFTHDGPGFPLKVFNSLRYKMIKNKISKTVPSSSIVGMLLYSRESYKVIKASGVSINQHCALNWHIKNSDFVYLNDLSWSSKHFDKTISNWINSLDKKRKEDFINALYEILENENFDAKKIGEGKYLSIYNTIRKGLKNVDKETKEKIMYVAKRLIYYERLNILNSDDEN